MRLCCVVGRNWLRELDLMLSRVVASFCGGLLWRLMRSAVSGGDACAMH